MALRSRAARPHHAVGSGMCRVLWFPPGRGIYCPNTSSIRPRGTLNLSDLALDNHTAPSMARLCIKQSKTDPFRQGVEVFLGKTGSEVCPIQALVHYIGVRSPLQGPLFILQSGAPLTRPYLVSQLQAALRRAGIEDSRFNGHSFRIGAATTAAQQVLEDSLIQTLGRWRSDAYKIYIKLPRSQLASVSKTLTQ
jgi:hypothetical protein